MRSTCLPERSKPLLLPTQVVSTSATWTQPLFMRESRRPAFHAYPYSIGDCIEISGTVRIRGGHTSHRCRFLRCNRCLFRTAHSVVETNSQINVPPEIIP